MFLPNVVSIPTDSLSGDNLFRVTFLLLYLAVGAGTFAAVRLGPRIYSSLGKYLIVVTLVLPIIGLGLLIFAADRQVTPNGEAAQAFRGEGLAMNGDRWRELYVLDEGEYVRYGEYVVLRTDRGWDLERLDP